jgi:hypothetical protein
VHSRLLINRNHQNLLVIAPSFGVNRTQSDTFCRWVVLTKLTCMLQQHGVRGCFYCPMLRRLGYAEFQELQKEPMCMRYGISRRTNISIRMFCRQLWQFGCCNPHTMPGHINMNKAYVVFKKCCNFKLLKKQIIHK